MRVHCGVFFPVYYKISVTSASIMNMITNHRATLIVKPAIPLNPTRPATIARTKKVKAQLSKPAIYNQENFKSLVNIAMSVIVYYRL